MHGHGSKLCQGGLGWSGRVFKEYNKNDEVCNKKGEVVTAPSLSVFRSHLENVLINKL